MGVLNPQLGHTAIGHGWQAGPNTWANGTTLLFPFSITSCFSLPIHNMKSARQCPRRVGHHGRVAMLGAPDGFTNVVVFVIVWSNIATQTCLPAKKKAAAALCGTGGGKGKGGAATVAAAAAQQIKSVLSFLTLTPFATCNKFQQAPAILTLPHI